MFIGSSYMYEDYNQMCIALKQVGEKIQKYGYSEKFGPLVFGVTGTGRVSQGIMEVLLQLPHQQVKPCELESVV